MRGDAVRRRDVLRMLAFGGASAGAGGLTFLWSTAGAAQQLSRRGTPAPKRPTIVLDPGHGGVDPGTIGVSGVYEKEIALDAARELAHQLERGGRYRVALTRTGDEFIPLRERVARARAAGADLFISMHADALPNHAMRGASVFTLSEQASDKEAAALAARENKVDLIGGIDLSRHAPEVGTILLDLARRQTNNLSIGLARRLVTDLGQSVVLLENSHRSAGFAVLKAPDVPSVLIEMGCLSNPEEDRLLRTASYRKRLATSILHSVDAYFETILKA
jgi:N-acetylmuramoyl-L-alanine amidase